RHRERPTLGRPSGVALIRGWEGPTATLLLRLAPNGTGRHHRTHRLALGIARLDGHRRRRELRRPVAPVAGIRAHRFGIPLHRARDHVAAVDGRTATSTATAGSGAHD